MSSVNLSYVIATYNKLPYLEVSLPKLIAARHADEEIIVVDGGSKDGTSEYLSQLQNEGMINYFISEPDYGESHATNKGIFMANGSLIKIITDDDAFHYPSIKRCKDFMLEHDELDVLSTDGFKARSHNDQSFNSMKFEPRFCDWQKKHTPFASCGLGLMLRRTSLPVLGFFNTNIVRTDAEYTLRMTASKAKVAWLTLETYAHVLNTRSTSNTKRERMRSEMDQLEAFYYPEKFYLPLKNSIRTLIHKYTINDQSQTVKSDSESHFQTWRTLFENSLVMLERNTVDNSGKFLYP